MSKETPTKVYIIMGHTSYEASSIEAVVSTEAQASEYVDLLNKINDAHRAGFRMECELDERSPNIVPLSDWPLKTIGSHEMYDFMELEIGSLNPTAKGLARILKQVESKNRGHQKLLDKTREE